MGKPDFYVAVSEVSFPLLTRFCLPAAPLPQSPRKAWAPSAESFFKGQEYDFSDAEGDNSV
jgi:hypothetical protein